MGLHSALSARSDMPEAGANWTIPECGIELIWIAPGSFTMGSPANEAGRFGNETQHHVTLTKGYWLGKYEVTQLEWLAVMGSNPCSFHSTGGRAPVEGVSWVDAVEFCKRITQRARAEGRLPTGYEYALPTEAQWEYACRAGTDTKFSFGNNDGDLHRYGNYCDLSNTEDFDWKDKANDDGFDKTAPVGSFKPNAWDLYDMQGNLWEWTFDRYGSYPDGAVTDPLALMGTLPVVRGGAWDCPAGSCRSAARIYAGKQDRSCLIGFRLALRPIIR